MTPEIFALSRPYLTIYTQSEEPQARDAPPVIRSALSLASSNEKPDGDSDSADDDDDQADDDADTPPRQTTSAASSAAKPKQEEVIDIEADAHGSAGGVFLRRAIVRIDPSNPKGYSVLDWRRADSPG